MAITQKVMEDYSRDRGYSKEFIAGLLGNTFRESAFDPFAIGRNDVKKGVHSYGLFQWNRGRKNGLYKLLKERGFSDPESIFEGKGKGLSDEEKRKFIITQLDFALNHDGKDSEKLQKVLSSDDLEDVKDAFAKFERFQGYDKPNHKSYKKHQKLINQFYGNVGPSESKEVEASVDISDPYKIPSDKKDIKAWMKQHNYKADDLKRPDGSWYHPGESLEIEDPRFEDEEEFEEFKIQNVVDQTPDIDPRFEDEKEFEEFKIQNVVDENADAIEYSKIRDEGGYEDPAGGDLPSYKDGGAVEPDFDRFLKFMDKGVDYSLRKKRIQKSRLPEEEKKKLLKELGEDPKFAGGGHVKKYNTGGAAMLTAGDSGSGGVLPEEEWWKFSVEELKEARQKYPTRSVERERVNQLIRLRMDAQKYKPHEGYKWGGQKDPTGIGAGVGESTITEYDSDGNIVLSEEEKEEKRRAYYWTHHPETAKRLGMPKPEGTGVHPSKAHLVAGAEEGELTPLDPTKSPEYSVMGRTVAGKEPGAQIEDTTKVTVTEDVTKTAPTTKTKSQAEIDAEQALAKAKEEDAYLDQQKRAIASEIQKFNDEQNELVKIDPDRFWKEKGTVSKIVGLIGTIGGAYISGRYGGPNEWEQMIDRAIDRDIAAQKLDRDHAVKKKLAAQKRIEMLMKHYEFMTKDKTAKANLALAREKLKNARLKGNTSHIKEQLAARDATAMGRGMTDQQLAVYNARYPKDNVRKRAIKSTKDGLWYVFPDEAMKKKVLDNVNAGEKSINNIKELKALVKDVGWATALPGFMQEFDPRLKKAKVLRESLKGALRLEIFGPGVMTDTERALADEIIGDPSKLFTRDKTQLEMLDTLQAKINYGMRQQLKRAGIKVPPDQNEIKIKEMLAQKGWVDDGGENRAKVVNALIKLEQKHRTGKYWKFDSQIPI